MLCCNFGVSQEDAAVIGKAVEGSLLAEDPERRVEWCGRLWRRFSSRETFLREFRSLIQVEQWEFGASFSNWL